MNAYALSPSLPCPAIISGSMISDRYLIQTVLGQGEWGNTYLAVDSYRFYEPCVLKEFNPILTDIDSSLREKLPDLLEQEAECLYQLNHPQLPRFFAYFNEQGRFFLVQEYIQGKSYCQLLQQRLQQGKTFTETEIVQWLINLLPILTYIHDRGVIHRDISLQNIIQSDDRDLPILIDFSVGKQSISLLEKENKNLPNSMDSFSNSMIVTRSLVNKIGYVPYEQIKLGVAFPCSDLYALGVTAIVLLTGKQPSVLINWDTLEWQWDSSIQVSESCTRIINKLLAYNPKNRYQSAKEVLHALQPGKQTKSCSSQTTNISEKNNNSAQFKNTQIREQEDTKNESGAPSASQSKSLIDKSYSPNPEFLQLCQQKLAGYIGPIANLIIEEVLDSRMCLSNEEFIRAIATEIPDWQQSLEFQQAIHTETK